MNRYKLTVASALVSIVDGDIFMTERVEDPRLSRAFPMDSARFILVE